MRLDIMAKDSSTVEGNSDLPCPAWLASELTYLSDRVDERVEEFAFQVSQDLKWLEDFAQEIGKTKGHDSMTSELKDSSTLSTMVRSPLRDITNVSIFDSK